MIDITELPIDFRQHGNPEWTQVDGYPTPCHFGSPSAEYESARTSAIITPRDYRAFFTVGGEDRVSWLQNMISNSVVNLQPGQSCEAALLTVKGKFVAHLRVLALHDCFLIETDRSTVAAAMADLSRYIIVERVDLEDLTGRWAVIGVHGPRAHELVTAAIGRRREGESEWSFRLGEHQGFVIPAIYAGLLGFDVHAPASVLPELWQRLLDSERDARPCGVDALEVLRVEAGEPRWGAEITEDRFPQEVGIDSRVIDYDKGCYRGQETIARLHARGHTNRSLVGARLDGRAKPGDELVAAGKPVGWLTSVVWSPRMRSVIALAYLRNEFTAPGSAITIDRDNAEITGAVCELPFVAR